MLRTLHGVEKEEERKGPEHRSEEGAATMISPPWPHQLAAYAFAADPSRRGVLLNMGMRTGKSRVVVDLVSRGWRRVLIFCPKSVVPVWEEQFEKWGNTNVLTLDGKETWATKTAWAHHMEQYAIRHLVFVANYAALLSPDFMKFARSHFWDCIVMDEIHHLKSAGGRMSRAAASLAPYAAKRIGLSGTPLAHSPLDIYAQYRFLDSSIYGTSNARFTQRFAVRGGYMGHEVIGYQNQEEFQRKLGSIMFSYAAPPSSDPPLHNEVPVILGEKARKVYDKLEKDFVAEVEGGTVTAGNALVKLLRLQQLTGGTLTLDGGDIDEIDDAKGEALGEILSGLPEEEPVVVFARFRADLDRIDGACFAMKRPCWELSGKRSEVNTWKKHGGVLAVQMQAGSEGIDLSNAAYVVYYSHGFSLAEYLQSEARVMGPNQKRHVVYDHLIVRDSVDVKVRKALRERRDVVEAIMEGIRK